MEFTAEQIASFLGAEVVGNKDAKVNTFAKIEEATKGALAFMSNPKYEEYLYSTGASIVIVSSSFEPKQELPVGTTLLKTEDAYGAFAKLLELYAANKPKPIGISTKASVPEEVKLTGEECYVGDFTVIEPSAQVGENCRIYPQVYIGHNVRIGKNVILYPGVKIYEECVLGDNITIHAGSVIGADGFGFAPNADGSYTKIPQIGNVVLEDNVEIGANTCIDRATMGSTIIKQGTKLDNLIQIAHNTSVGENTVLAAQVGVAGSTKIGDRVMMGGQVGVAGHITIADGVKVGSQTGVNNSIKQEGASLLGSPAMPGMDFHRSFAVFKDLPELRRRVNALEEAQNTKK